MDNISQVLGIEGGLTKKAYSDLLLFKIDVNQRFGGMLKSVILFGSRARLEARSGSDIDVAVILDQSAAGTATDRILSRLAYPYVLKGTHISALSLPVNLKKQAENSLLVHTILNEGLEVV